MMTDYIYQSLARFAMFEDPVNSSASVVPLAPFPRMN